MINLVIIKSILQIAEDRDNKKGASTPGAVCTSECFCGCLRCAHHILHFALSGEQPPQRKAAFGQLAEMWFVLTTMQNQLRGCCRNLLFIWLIHTFPLKMQTLLHEVFSQGSKAPFDMNFLV